MSPRPEFYCSLVGEQELRDRMLLLDRATQGDVMRPIVAEASTRLRELARSMAPRRTGGLRQGIVARELKWGPGYCQFVVTLDPAVWWGKFQEFGLGTGSATPPSARTLKRRAAYAQSMLVRRRVKIAQGKGGLTHKQAVSGLSKAERRRQNLIAKGGYIQGQRRPNMKAHPFLRPAVNFLRKALRAWMVAKIWQSIAALGVSQPQKAA